MYLWSLIKHRYFPGVHVFVYYLICKFVLCNSALYFKFFFYKRSTELAFWQYSKRSEVL